jgi:hypothetical protein
MPVVAQYKKPGEIKWKLDLTVEYISCLIKRYPGPLSSNQLLPQGTVEPNMPRFQVKIEIWMFM